MRRPHCYLVHREYRKESSRRTYDYDQTVGELCKQIKGIYNLNGSADTVITGISSDSRQIEAGYLFVCISGVHVDGAAFAAQAVEKGPSPS